MSDYNEFMEYYKKHWEKSLSERTNEFQAEVESLRQKLAVAEQALEIISKEETDSVLPVNLYIAPTNVKRDYMDEAYRLIAREALAKIRGEG